MSGFRKSHIEFNRGHWMHTFYNAEGEIISCFAHKSVASVQHACGRTRSHVVAMMELWRVSGKRNECIELAIERNGVIV